MKSLVINGRFLGQPLSGVQRYATEIVKALDAILGHSGEQPVSCVLAAPPGARPIELSSIAVRTVASPALIAKLLPAAVQGHAWEQSTLAASARGAVLLNLCGSAPLGKADQLTVIHDAAIYRNPQFFSRAYRFAHGFLDRRISACSRIASVSQFSSRELGEVLGIDPAGIVVSPNGADHLGTAVDIAAPTRLGLDDKPFFVFVGNLTPNKNLAAAVQAIAALGGAARLAVVGASNQRVFSAATGAVDDDVRMLGRVDDETLAGLLRSAAALVFPSFYEGFGIPPLEAMTQGCPVIASRIPAVEETCADAALYFAPDSPAELAQQMQLVLTEPTVARAERIARGHARSARFTWRASAQQLHAALLPMLRG